MPAREGSSGVGGQDLACFDCYIIQYINYKPILLFISLILLLDYGSLGSLLFLCVCPLHTTSDAGPLRLYSLACLL